MDISRGTAILEKKNLILVTPDREKRLAVVDLLASHFKSQGYAVYRFPETIKTGEKYLRAAVKLFPLVSPLKIPKEQMGLDAINDVQLDGIEPAKKNAVILPELQKLRKEDTPYFRSLISHYLTHSVQMWEAGDKKNFRFLVAVDELPPDFLNTLEIYYGTKESRRPREMANEHIAIYAYL